MGKKKKREKWSINLKNTKTKDHSGSNPEPHICIGRCLFQRAICSCATFSWWESLSSFFLKVSDNADGWLFTKYILWETTLYSPAVLKKKDLWYCQFFFLQLVSLFLENQCLYWFELVLLIHFSVFCGLKKNVLIKCITSW